MPDHPEGGHHGIISHLFYFIISWFDVSDHKAGVFLLVSALLIQTGFNQSSLSKVLISDVGGSKRLRALSMLMSCVILSPWAVFNLFTSVCCIQFFSFYDIQKMVSEYFYFFLNFEGIGSVGLFNIYFHH